MKDYTIIFKEIEKYKGKEVLCINESYGSYDGGNNVHYNFDVDKFYLLENVRYASGKHYNIEDIKNNDFELELLDIEVVMVYSHLLSEPIYDTFSYDDFINLFELVTLAELRQRKIDSILK